MASADIIRAGHSPLPWTLAASCRRGNKIQCSDPDGADWPWDVATCHVEAPVDRTGKANAAFIVRACNAHYQMLEALKAIDGVLSQAYGDVSDPAVQHSVGELGAGPWIAVRAAIAAAEAEAGR